MDWLEIKEFIKDTIKLGIVLAIILLIMIYVFSITQVVGNSMNPTLKDNQILILDKIKYRFNDVKRKEIISFEYADTKYLIKRVIGLPGDKVYIKDSKVYINDEELEEDYLIDDLVYDDFYLSDLGYDAIPEDMFFVLGDNRVDSLDSREIGLIKKDDILGKIAFK